MACENYLATAVTVLHTPRFVCMGLHENMASDVHNRIFDAARKLNNSDILRRV